MDQFVIEKAIEAAQKGNCSKKHCAVMVRRGRIIGIAVNTHDTKNTVHAEVALKRGLHPKFRKKGARPQGDYVLCY